MTQEPYKPYPDHYDYIRDSDGHAVREKTVYSKDALGNLHQTTFEVDATLLYDPGPGQRERGDSE